MYILSELIYILMNVLNSWGRDSLTIARKVQLCQEHE